MKVNSLNAMKAYQKVNSFKTSPNKACDTKKTSKCQVKSNTDTISFTSTKQGKIDYEAKVNNLKNQVQNGTYKIDTDKIATKLLNRLFI